MHIIKDFTVLEGKVQGLPSSSAEMFQVGAGKGETGGKITTFLDYLYSYPPKFKVRWNSLDELSEDLFLKTNYGVLQHSFPFLDFVEDFIFQQIPTYNLDNYYSKDDLISGYKNRISASNFYLKKAQAIQTSLSTVPVFVILNGYNEIVLSGTERSFAASNFASYINQTLYNTCGAFDPFVENSSKLGLFFLNRLDAETYRQEIMKTDVNGTKKVGLSIHCIGMDSAYRITREHHPRVDFRFVPNLKEVQTLLTQLGEDDYLVDDNQHQLRFRRRSVNLFPNLGYLGLRLSPANSFLQRNEYFKGVPVYIVQTSQKPRNILFEGGFRLLARMDSIYAKFMQNLDNAVGLGHNWIMQGSLKYDGTDKENVTSYVFFKKEDADNFIKKHGRKISRYKGSRSSNIEFAVKLPKLCISNLEDFLEWWEENLQNPSKKFLNKEIYFIPASTTVEELETLKQDCNPTLLNRVSQNLTLKYKSFKSFLSLFFGVGYV